MRTQFSKLALTAALMLAITLTFSCSGDDGDEGGGGGGSGGASATGTFKDDRDGKSYKWVKIGEQVWMAENLKAEGGVCYDDDPANCATYGSLYTWATAMTLPSPECNDRYCTSQISEKHKGICPSGWHIPSNADWDVLMKFVNPSCSDNSGCAVAGTKLKAKSGWNDYDGKSGNGTDAYGFAALPGGILNNYFDDVGYYGVWWSAKEYDLGNAYTRGMSYDSEDVFLGHSYKSRKRSVRCVQD